MEGNDGDDGDDDRDDDGDDGDDDVPPATKKFDLNGPPLSKKIERALKRNASFHLRSKS